MRVIHTDGAQSQTGPVPQAVEAGGSIHVSAVFGADPLHHTIHEDARAEAEQICDNLPGDPHRRRRCADRHRTGRHRHAGSSA